MNYQKIYNALVIRGQNRVLDCYIEKHHIIPRCCEGANKKSNITHLTPREHFIAHRLLTKIYSGQLKHKLIYALNRLVNRFTKRNIHVINSRTYNEVKTKHAYMMSTREVTAETRKKMSEYRTGRPMTEETKQKISEYGRGRAKSAEWKQKISKAHLGKPKSPEAIAKRSKTIKKEWGERPWKNPRANLSVWALAEVIFNMKKQKVSGAKIDQHLGFPFSSIRNMEIKIIAGWNPLEDIFWLEDFGDTLTT